MDNLSPGQIRELRNILTNDEPLGPSNAEALAHSSLGASLLFERQNAIYSELMNRSGILIGRRGSGKTAFLSQLRAAGAHRHLVFVSAPNVFPEILRSIRKIFGDSTPLVEVVESLWAILIWCCVFAELLRTGNDARLRTVRDLANRVGFDSSQAPEVVITRTIERLQRHVDLTSSVIDSPLRLEMALTFESVSFSDARKAAMEILKNAATDRDVAPVLVLMDTLEEYRVDLREASIAVSGLLRYLGHQYVNQGFLDIRFCLPTELYAVFQTLSTNSMKDFSSRTILRWHAGDLLRVAAHRLSLFLRLHDPEHHSRIVQSFDLNRRDGAANFFASLLPKTVVNRGGTSEAPIAYILRHTQLLPRHIIEIFNRVFTGLLANPLQPVSASAVRAGVQECEYIICNGVARAYSHCYPDLQDICAVAMPELPRSFADGDLRKVYNQHVKGVLKKSRRAGQIVELEYHDFKRMLIEIGAIGKMTKETDVYIEAEFEYTVTSKLVVASDDTLCVHPLFSGVYPRNSELNGSKKPVYPHGSDPG